MDTLVLVLKLIPSVVAAVQAAEAAFPLPGQGKAKLDLVLGVITDAYAEAQKVIPELTAIVGRFVTFFNAVGVFKK